MRHHALTLTSLARIFLLVIGATACAGPAHGDGSCDAFLSCINASSPELYAAALRDYGDDSPCWDSDSNADACSKACTASLQHVGAACSCEGDSCTAVDLDFTLAPGIYKVTSGREYMPGSDGCQALNALQQATWKLSYPIDATHVVMDLTTTISVGMVDLNGTVTARTGTIWWTYYSWRFGANIALVADNTFDAGVSVDLFQPDTIESDDCHSTLSLRFARQ